MWCVSVLCCPVLCSVVLCCRVAVCCPALLFVCVVACACCLLPVAALSAVCVLGCRAVRSLSSPLCAVLCRAVLVRLGCAIRVVCAVSGAWCCCSLVSLPVVWGPLVGLVPWRCLLLVCVGIGVRVWPCRPSLGVMVWFPVVFCSPVLCSVVLYCRVVLCCGALSSLFALLMPLVFCFSLKISCKTRKNVFQFLKIN